MCTLVLTACLDEFEPLDHVHPLPGVIVYCTAIASCKAAFFRRIYKGSAAITNWQSDILTAPACWGPQTYFPAPLGEVYQSLDSFVDSVYDNADHNGNGEYSHAIHGCVIEATVVASVVLDCWMLQQQSLFGAGSRRVVAYRQRSDGSDCTRRVRLRLDDPFSQRCA